MSTRTPSHFQVERAMTALLEARAALLADDPDMAEADDLLWQSMLDGQAEGDPFGVIDRLVATAIEASDFADIAAKRAAELRERSARFKRRHDRLRTTVQQMLEALDISRLQRADYSASIKAAPPHVVIVDEAVIPREYMRIKAEPAKSAILTALKAGEHVAGTELSNAGTSLTIKVT